MSKPTDKPTPDRDAALAALQETVPARLYRFAELLMSADNITPEQAAEQVGAAGAHKAMLTDKRVQMVMATIGAELRDSFRSIRIAAVGMLASMLVSDVLHAVDEDGSFRHLRDMPAGLRACIEAYEVRSDGSVKIKFAPKRDLLRMWFELWHDLPVENANLIGQAGGAGVQSVRVSFYGRDPDTAE